MIQHVDYIIIGQGLAGSALAWELIERGKSVIVIDKPGSTRASVVAAGLFNPITGKFMTKAWKADSVFPCLEEFYSGAGRKLNKQFLNLLPIYRPFISTEERLQWKIRSESEEMTDVVKKFYDSTTFKEVKDPFGGIDINHSGYLDVGLWLSSLRTFLKEKGSLMEENFEQEKLDIKEVISYEEITADKIIFCNGLAAMNTPLFNWLPFRPLKGETLEIEVEQDFPRLFNRAVYVVPLGEHIYNVGATYQHPPYVENTTDSSLADLLGKLHALLNVPVKIIHQDWGIRPTTPDRRPFIGSHPANKNVIIFNGLGTKGVSLAPYFARHLADWMEGIGDLSTEVNIYRFKALYWG
ncbi:FAD-dependent oxidoreductase [soil metagenome]